MNIAIDGPAGAGKSSAARGTAKALGVLYVDTGAMYRAMGLWFLRAGVSPDDAETISRECGGVEISLKYVDGEQRIFLGGEDVSEAIRTEEVGNMASAVSVYPAVRTRLVEMQQEIARRNDVVMDGRDIGTVVLPDAEVKIYLTASVEVRAERRRLELAAKGDDRTLEEVIEEISERDYRDTHRETSPLKQADDAVLLDSSNLDRDQVIGRILEIVRAKEA